MKIENVVDIITNSSSEIYVIDTSGLDKELSLVDQLRALVLAIPDDSNAFEWYDREELLCKVDDMDISNTSKGLSRRLFDKILDYGYGYSVFGEGRDNNEEVILDNGRSNPFYDEMYERVKVQYEGKILISDLEESRNIWYIPRIFEPICEVVRCD